MEGRTVESFLREFLLWSMYEYDPRATNILSKYAERELEAYVLLEINKSGRPVHAFIFKGDRKRFAFENGLRVPVVSALHTINDWHRDVQVIEGKEVSKELMRDTILRSV